MPGARPAVTPARHLELVARPWTMPRQVHSARVLVVDSPSGPLAEEADALVSCRGDVALAVIGADCPLIGLSSPEGAFGVVHAGWRGLLAGVVEASAKRLVDLGASRLEAVVSPFVHVECYPFRRSDAALLAQRYGEAVLGTSANGEDALDLEAVVSAALARAGVPAPVALGGCSACGGQWYSHRARGEAGRHALVCWQE